jgi:putative addiction module CopG family antidote
MTILLPREWERFVEERIAAGQYASAAEVIGAGLRLLKAREELRADIAAGIEQAERGQVAPFSATETLARVRGVRPEPHD